MTTVSVWVLLITLSGRGYLGSIDNIATKEECERIKQYISNTAHQPIIYASSVCIQVKKIKGKA